MEVNKNEVLKPTTISYKKTKDDRELREWIHCHSNYSGFIKDILRRVMNEEMNQSQENRNSNVKNEVKEKELIDLGDF